jgi:murein DD-endopeptidase MepM/ murein hydrolase activator NlpD
VLLTPLISVILTSTASLFSLVQLSVFSLPFNIVVLLFLYSLKLRERFHSKPGLVMYQQFTPEKNLYSHLNYSDRFGKTAWIPLSLPFFGEWKVTQGHSGEFTHKGDWKHAWDFEIDGQDGKTYQERGENTGDYYCYGKPVLSPGDGWIEEVLDGVDDNEIGQSNVKHNWGNLVVIRHSEYLYTKLCHLRKHSIKVSKGSYVHTGDLIATCGNSGRSPVPHLHFQIQAYPHIGSRTIEYPLSNYIVKQGDEFLLHSGGIPELNDTLLNIEPNQALEEAFHFIPGQKMKFRVNKDDEEELLLSWEVQAGFDNKPYILCNNTGSKAYFTYINKVLSFTHYSGPRNSILWYFYLSAYKVATGFYKGMIISDSYSLNNISQGPIKIIQDFVAPFFIFLKTSYTLHYVKQTDDFTSSSITLSSESVLKSGTLRPEKISSVMEISRQGIMKFTVTHNNKTIQAIRNEQD